MLLGIMQFTRHSYGLLPVLDAGVAVSAPVSNSLYKRPRPFRRVHYRPSTTTMSTINRDPSELPPKREKPSLAPVERPLKYTRLNRLIYLLLLLSTLLSAYYGYRVVQWKTEVGGWWNLAVGKRPPQLKYEGAGGERPKGRKEKKSKGKDAGETVEDRINALADALGMPSRDLASAIAGAVKQYVPPASLSSVAAHQTGEAVDTLLKETEKTDEERKTEKDAEGGGGIAEGIASGMGSFVGMDEP